MKIKEYKILQELNIVNSKRELENYANKTEDKIWGYFPGMEKDEKIKYPETLKLAEQISNLMGENIDNLSFIKICKKKPEKEFGGFHLDTKAKTIDKENNKGEILRTIINLNNEPRKLMYCPLSIEELKEKGIETSYNKYKSIELPKKIETKTIEVPSLTKDSIYALKFISTKILHLGMNDENGHFLVSFGKYQ